MTDIQKESERMVSNVLAIAEGLRSAEAVLSLSDSALVALIEEARAAGTLSVIFSGLIDAIDGFTLALGELKRARERFIAAGVERGKPN